MFPTRRAYAWLAVGVMLFAIYASLLPFDLHPASMESAFERFRRLMLAPSSRPVPRANFVANILLFVPVGFGLMGAWLVDRTTLQRALVAAVAAMSTSVAVSLTAEFLQLFAPERVVSRADVVAQTIGCVIGILTWSVIGPQLTDWLRAASGTTREDRLARALLAYAVAWIFVNLAPFDITVDVGQLGRRVRTGLITIVPFGGPDLPASRVVWDAAVTAISAVPLGVLSVIGWTGRSAQRHAGVACFFGATLVALLEVAQIFIRSHSANVTDILFGWLGVALGVWGALALGRRPIEVISSPGVSKWAIAAVATWTVLLCAYHWQPFDFTLDEVAIRDKAARISLVPFAGYRSGSDLNAFNNLLAKLGVSMPLGVIAAFVLRRAPIATSMLVTSWVVSVVFVFGVIEVGQFFLPSRVPDPSDVLVGVVGSCAGLALGRRLLRGDAQPTPHRTTSALPESRDGVD